MKRLALGLTTLASLTAFAGESRQIQDLQYLPNAGTTFGQTTLGYSSGEAKAGRFEADFSNWSGRQTLGHAFTDRFLVSASIGYMTGHLDNNQGTDRRTNVGWTDPAVDGKFRLVDESFRLDLLAGGVMSTGPASIGDSHANNKGAADMNFNGGPSAYAGLQAGQKLDNIQYAFLLIANRNFKATERLTGGSVRDDAHTSYLMEASLLNTLADKLTLRSHVSARFIEGYDDNDGGSTAPMTEYKIGSGPQYNFSENLLGFGTIEYRKLNSDTGFVDDFHFWNFSAGARYQF